MLRGQVDNSEVEHSQQRYAKLSWRQSQWAQDWISLFVVRIQTVEPAESVLEKWEIVTSRKCDKRKFLSPC